MSRMLIESRTAATGEEWVLFKVACNQDRIMLATTYLTDLGKNQIAALMETEACEDITALLDKFRGKLTLLGPCSQMTAAPVQEVVNKYFNLLVHLDPRKDYAPFSEARINLQNASLSTRVEISWEI